MTVMLTGSSDNVDSAIDMLSPFEILETVRTGKVVIARGEEKT